MTKMSILTWEEAAAEMAYYWLHSMEYYYTVALENGKPVAVFVLKNNDAIVRNSDGSVTWTAQEINFTLHSFIKLTTGEEYKRTIYLPICLVNPKTREAFEPLILSTVDPEDGRLNSKDAECYIILPSGQAFKIKFPLPGLTMAYLALQFMPSDFPDKMRFENCKFCNMKAPKPNRQTIGRSKPGQPKRWRAKTEVNKNAIV